MADCAHKVLFLCTGNSARSIIGEAILNRLGQGRFDTFSAGSRPTGTVNPNTLRLLERLDYDISRFRSKSWEEFARPGAPELDFLFTVCDDAAGESCPIWPGKPMTAHWGIPDPARATGAADEIADAFKEAYCLMFLRIARFTSLPFDSLDNRALGAALCEIGHAQGASINARKQT